MMPDSCVLTESTVFTLSMTTVAFTMMLLYGSHAYVAARDVVKQTGKPRSVRSRVERRKVAGHDSLYR